MRNLPVCCLILSVNLASAALAQQALPVEEVRRPTRPEVPVNWPRLAEIDPVRRLMWGHLHRYLSMESDAPTDQLRTAAIELLHQLADRRCEPLAVPGDWQLGAMRRLGPFTWQGSAKPYRLWMLPLAGQVVLFGYPGPDPLDPATLYQIHLIELIQEPKDSPGLARAKDELRNEMARRGRQRWSFLFLRVFPETVSGKGDFPRLEQKGDNFAVELDGRRTLLELPGSETLQEQIGRLFADRISPPADDRKIYLAIDWCEFLAESRRRQWLLSELQSVVQSWPDDAFADQAVFLHTSQATSLWPLADLRKGRWADPLPASHHQDTVGSLGSAIAEASTRQDVRLVFFTWNAGLSTPEDGVTALEQLGRRLSVPDPAASAKDVELEILQVHGQRVKFFEQLAGQRHYNLFEYRPDGPASVMLPAGGGR